MGSPAECFADHGSDSVRLGYRTTIAANAAQQPPGGRPSIPRVTMLPASRAALTYCLGLIGGAALFFLVFAAIFTGAWPLLLAFGLCYAGAGAVGVRKGGVDPIPFALVLVLPTIPWILWLFPASVAEDGLLRALWWPAIALIAWALAWLGGSAAAKASSRAC
jgi:hypothetical protein